MLAAGGGPGDRLLGRQRLLSDDGYNIHFPSTPMQQSFFASLRRCCYFQTAAEAHAADVAVVVA